MSKKFPFYEQLDSMDCGVACLRMIANYYGREYDANRLRDHTYIDREGASLLGISHAAEQIGLKTMGSPIPYDRLSVDIPLPAIAHWDNEHFIVVYKVTTKEVWIGDPAQKGITKISKEVFLEGWHKPTLGRPETGILLMMEPMSDFLEREGGPIKKDGFAQLYSYLKKYQPLTTQILVGIGLVGFIQFAFPFLIKAIIDIGVSIENATFIYMVLIAFLVLYLTQTFVEMVRNRIISFVGTKINAELMSEFIAKLMQLPVKYFDSHIIGDVLQRIYDNKRVEKLLSTTSVFALFSLVNLVISAFILFLFSTKIFLIFLFGTIAYFGWSFYCLNKRNVLETKRFDYAAQNQNALFQLIAGIHEIKQHNVEIPKRWEWEGIQKKIYDINKEYFQIEQQQRTGGNLINDFKNIIITVVAAQAIIHPDQVMTLGTLVAIQYIIGQLNGPMEQITQFLGQAQDAKLSVERMSEIHQSAPQEDQEGTFNELPESGDIVFENVTFQYNGPTSPVVLRNIDLTIPEGKTTAIVGSSGSGKTTLLKLILGTYQPTEGTLKLGGINLATINKRLWRDQYGVVEQNGYIFTDTITGNIAFGDSIADKRQVVRAAKISNIQNHIEKLRLGYSTIIGPDTVSGGQKQRFLIARAVYKNPEYLFLDEPTNPLDSYNEMVIMENIEDYFVDKTIVIVAQRLSTIINADHIIVVEDGEIIEQGTHDYLLNLRGAYFQMHRNQTELTVFR